MKCWAALRKLLGDAIADGVPVKFKDYRLTGRRGGPGGNFTRLFEELGTAR